MAITSTKKLNPEQMAQLLRAEHLLGEAASIIDCIENDEGMDETMACELHEAYEGAYSAMCDLANYRTSAV